MNLTEGSNINGFRILTENDICDDYYITPKKVDDKSFAGLFTLNLDPLYVMGYGTLMIGFRVKNFMSEADKMIDAEVSIKIRLESGQVTSTMNVKNESTYDLTNILTARITTDNNVVVYANIENMSDYIICKYEYINYYTDNMKYGDMYDFIKPSSKTLNGNRIGGTDISATYDKLKFKDVYRLNTAINLTSSEITLTSEDFTPFLNSNDTLINAIKNSGTYEIELTTTFSGTLTDDNCYVVIQVNNATAFVNKFKITSSSSQASSVVSKFYRKCNKGDVISMRIVNSQSSGLTLTNNSYIKIQEM